MPKKRTDAVARLAGTMPAPDLPVTGSRVAGWLSIAVGVAVLVGWVFDLPTLKSVLPGVVSMKANTALGIVLAGLSLAIVTRGPGSLLATRALAFATALIGISANRYVVISSTFTVDKDCTYDTDWLILFMGLTGDGKIAVGADVYAKESLVVPIADDLGGGAPPVRLALPFNYAHGEVRGVSNDGTTMVGLAYDPFKPAIAVYWDSNYQDWLTAQGLGVQLKDWSLVSANAATRRIPVVGTAEKADGDARRFDQPDACPGDGHPRAGPFRVRPP